MSDDGQQWNGSDGTRHTVNSTDDPKVPGGYYHSQQDGDGNKATAVFNSDGSMANVSANRDWTPVSRQDS